MNVRHITLSEEEHTALLQGWKTGKRHPFRSRCNMILLSGQGYNATEIAALEGVSRQTVAHWLNVSIRATPCCPIILWPTAPAATPRYG